MQPQNLGQHATDENSPPAKKIFNSRPTAEIKSTNGAENSASLANHENGSTDVRVTNSSRLFQEKSEGDAIHLYPIEPPPPIPLTPPDTSPAFQFSKCNPTRIVVITVPPRGNFGNLTDANEEEFHFVNNFYEKVQLLGEIEKVFCYRECLPNGTTKNRMIVAFKDIRGAVQCVQSHDSRPFMGTKRITRCQFLSLEMYDRLKSLKPE